MSQEPTHVITEGIAGVWHYHWSTMPYPYRALCGRQVMTTQIKPEDWRAPFGEHFPKKPTWCKDCERLKVASNTSNEARFHRAIAHLLSKRDQGLVMGVYRDVHNAEEPKP